ncbi:hypothetical protein SeLEV6574_g05159 [Synchytrium endobioticum]|uniref:GH18 domain-containing protein n=1 Tax=Synchytrium endobioticum TaxID=286115 RepID=A0A507CVP1_9FUNG|nr:hypothetical protein SeLEV6574_g05159 [Synchytrium endobioticum]
MKITYATFVLTASISASISRNDAMENQALGFSNRDVARYGSILATAASACTTNSKDFKKVGYVASWAVERASPCKYNIDSIDAYSYTHLIFAFVTIDKQTWAPKFISDADASVLSSMVNLKSKNPGLKIFLSVGGWSFNDPGSGTETVFSQLAVSQTHQDAFSKGMLALLDDNRCDGVDIDWEYPGDTTRGGTSADKAHLAQWMATLAQAMRARGYGVSMTLPATAPHFDAGFELSALQESGTHTLHSPARTHTDP